MQILHYLFELVRDSRYFSVGLRLRCVPLHGILASIVVVPGRRRMLFLTELSLPCVTV